MTPTLNELTVSVIVPVHNGGDDFRRCLLNLTTAHPSPREIIVVADGDSDGSWQVAREFGAQVLRLPTPRGPARARNLGANVARSDILFFVDADVAIAPDAIGQIITAFTSDSTLTAIFGSYDDRPAAPNFLSQYKNLFHHYVHQTAREEACTFWSGCGAVRREVFLSMGGFDESYQRPAIEDIELGYRLARAGHRIRLCKALQGKHLKRWGVVSLLKADFFQRALPWTELILQDGRFANDLNLKFSSRLSVMLTYALLGAVVGMAWWLGFLGLVLLLMVLLLALNASFYLFFWHKRGLWFTLQTIPWHWLYYFYSGLAFGAGVALHLSRKWFWPRTALPADPGELSYTE